MIKLLTSKEAQKKPRHQVRPIGREIFGIIFSIFILIGLVNIIITEGIIDSNKMVGLMGEISAAFEEDPIGNIFQFIRYFTLMVICLPAKIHPLAGYLIFMPLAIANLISCILKLFKSLLKAKT